ncbi:hypothetical protein NBT05_14140 [Aquimarina sp. ERC-38]|uniref:hypothetical protein n=1 Tax=Aquimarina sp. ERC-38 TaxID=2949996 RepID=UPI0022471270|nr:hypothetical protein [Aquimarina sp. ERC-38]UZO80082.1 hypothetical protein NBT05_14140 [Aquimarina sp. ERC-38]
MNKITKNLIILIGIISILASIYGLLNDRKLIEVIGGIAIGLSIIGSVFLRQNKNRS